MGAAAVSALQDAAVKLAFIIALGVIAGVLVVAFR